MRHHVKRCADRSNRCGNMGAKMRHRATFWCKLVKALRRYGRFQFFKLAAVRHLGFVIRLFGQPTKCILVVSTTEQNLA